ncbi:hypothetical protein ACFYS8_24395 [Kitasatospora sp. NPDC004615]|uniref:hypothetical protein n=1 Tax=Kitasatospora sp. NPDC004615 TaxID=3364017 RepID=UPI00368203AA
MDLLAQLDPVGPLTPFAADRVAVESWLGVRLPIEYWELTRYGTVVIGGEIALQAPTREQLGTLAWSKHDLRVELREAGVVPPRLYPAPGGLLPWGSVVNGRTFLCWNTADPDPDRWTVVLCDPTRPEPLLDSGLTLAAFLETVILDRVGHLGPLPATVAPHWQQAVRWSPSPRRELTGDEREFALHGPAGLAALRLLVPPPERPIADPLGARLPSDYRELMALYGRGTWSEWLGLPSLSRSDAPADGFLAIGTSIDADRLGWLVTGADPDTWPLVVRPRHVWGEVPLSGGLVAVLVGWLRGELDVPGLPGLDPEDDPFECAGFEPW